MLVAPAGRAALEEPAGDTGEDGEAEDDYASNDHAGQCPWVDLPSSSRASVVSAVGHDRRQPRVAYGRGIRDERIQVGRACLERDGIGHAWRQIVVRK